MGGNWRYKASKYMIKTQKNGSTPTKPASNSFGNRLLRTKKLSTYFNERYQNEVRHMRANQDDGKLNAWDRAWLLLAVQQNTSNALVKVTSPQNVIKKSNKFHNKTLSFNRVN